MRLFKATLALASALCFPPSLNAAGEWWLTESANYARPFQSRGYAGSVSDGYGVNGRLEYRAKNWISVGLGYGEVKLVQQGNNANQGFVDGSVRLSYANSFGLDPYVMIGLGSSTAATAMRGGQERGASFGGQAQAGLLWNHPASSWALDTGLGMRRTGADAAALNVAEGHFGLQFRFGEAHAKAKDEYLRAQARRLAQEDALASKPNTPAMAPAVALSARQASAQGLEQLAKGDLEKAEATLSQSLRLDPNNATAWHGLGNVKYLQALAKKKNAFKAWEISLKLKPNAKLDNYLSSVDPGRRALALAE